MPVFADIQFPAAVTATGPVEITISGNVYTFSFDPEALIASGESLGLVKASDLIAVEADGTINLAADLQTRFSYFGSIKGFATVAPTSPTEGDRYIIAAGATLAWAGYPHYLAEWRSGAWSYTAPNSKMMYVAESDHRAYVWSAASWVSIAEGRLTVALEADLGDITDAAENVQAEVIADVVATTTHRARASNVATITTAASHGLSVGDFVNVRGLGGTGYNGRVECITGTTGSTIVYNNTGGNESSTADTAGQIDRNGIYTSDGASAWDWIGDIGLAALEARQSVLEARMDALYDANETAIADMIAAAESDVADTISAANTAVSDFLTDAQDDVDTWQAGIESQINALVADASSLIFVRDAIFSPLANPSRGTLKALWYADGPKTFHAPGVVSTLVSLDANARTLGLHTTIFSGADPRPLVQDKGLYFNNQAGLNIANGILTQTRRFCIHHVFEIGVTNTYTLKTDMVAAGGTEGDIAKVTGDTNTTYSPDISNPFENGIADTELVNGYWLRTLSAWATSITTYELFAYTSSDGKYLKCYVNRLGQCCMLMYNGSRLDEVMTTGTNVIGNGRHQISVLRDEFGIHLFLDGVEIGFSVGDTRSGGVVSNENNITNLANFYLNGDSRNGSTSAPCGGIRHWFTAHMSAENPTWKSFAASYDAIADYAGTARLADYQDAWGVVRSGQSWADGATAVTDTWRPADGWDGLVDKECAGHSGEQIALTKEHIPHVYGHANYLENRYIGPIRFSTSSLSALSSDSKIGFTSTGETIEKSLGKHLVSYTGAPKVEWMFNGAAAGGWTLAQLTEETSPAPIVQGLKSLNEALTGGSAVMTLYEKLLQSIVYARDWAVNRGKRYKVRAFIWQQGHSDTSNTNYMTDFFTHYDKFNAAIKRITGQSDDICCFIPQINYSFDGVGTLHIGHASGADIDQAILNIIDNRGTRPIFCIGPMYQITSYIHPYTAGHRWIGELFGKAMTRVLVSGQDFQPLRPKTFTRGASYVDIAMWGVDAGKTIAIGQTNGNNIPAVIQTSGIDTHGIEYSGGGLTITSVAVQSASVLRVNLSGAPAAGHVISACDATSRVTNICVDNGWTAYYKDQDWTTSLISGSPLHKEGSLNDLRDWLCTFRKVLT